MDGMLAHFNRKCKWCLTIRVARHYTPNSPMWVQSRDCHPRRHWRHCSHWCPLQTLKSQELEEIMHSFVARVTGSKFTVTPGPGYKAPTYDTGRKVCQLTCARPLPLPLSPSCLSLIALSPVFVHRRTRPVLIARSMIPLIVGAHTRSKPRSRETRCRLLTNSWDCLRLFETSLAEFAEFVKSLHRISARQNPACASRIAFAEFIDGAG